MTKLKQLRLEKNLTMKEISHASGLDSTYIWRIENGKIPYPRFHTINKLIKAFEGYGVAIALAEFYEYIKEEKDNANV